ncbi:MAG: type II toxin-antitoxin system VapC family toxin [Thermoguttaceae bacterium]|jgi:predicted nucleic acid-binding protein|nr:type II toxin-antitoxin system VapC family toxin [Thermoguttaceae bacterium]
MIFDTDVLIWLLRGNQRAAQAIDRTEHRAISLISYMELLQGARNKGEIKAIKALLSELQVQLLPLSENIGHRASIYMEEYTLISALSMPDALIAATAIETNSPLLTGNVKHYRAINELYLERFRP